MESSVNCGVVPYTRLQTKTENFLKPTENFLKPTESLVKED